MPGRFVFVRWEGSDPHQPRIKRIRGEKMGDDSREAAISSGSKRKSLILRGMDFSARWTCKSCIKCLYISPVLLFISRYNFCFANFEQVIRYHL